MPTKSAPIAPAPNPAKVYLAKREVRCSSVAVAGNKACSVGKKTLTSPEEGLIVPIIATINSIQNQVTEANPMPVAIIAADAMWSRVSL
ncbi:unannotated protein [freshwater metagenome]|uniref:Unannotated protein n=1 Tax=freshwater metagenome TaxID=449393 RepID=A0A6J7RCZ1_9ZZZZ